MMLFTLYGQLFYSMKMRIETTKEVIQLHQEAAAFIHYLERESGRGEKLIIKRGELSFLHDNFWLDYIKRKESIIRQKGGEGYVTVCYYVQNFESRPLDSAVEVKLALKRNRSSIETVSILPLPSLARN
ncbi:hypothetical protein BEP19_00855 [Ammoniphilus oxalaticus]|uniref:Uncharacterized protein n=1 Tax=Ammoniphilus oxalaticus TaxID=66863 RepID=A0A419SMK3_9BACL|nr:hypothetical protein BEP19_00855 [Ammoniphilus oxalaticus]